MQIRILVHHPMYTGRQKDPAGRAIPAHFIEHLKILHNGELVIDCRLSTAVSADPYLAFRFDGGKPGDKVEVRWQDNLGQSDRQETLVR